jgi:hypothetical protein
LLIILSPQEFHMVAMLLVSKRLSRTVDEIKKRQQARGGDEGGGRSACYVQCCKYGGQMLSALVLILVVLDLSIAILDMQYGVSFDLQLIVTVLNSFFFGGMGLYYYRHGGAIAAMLRKTSSTGARGNARVSQFSGSVRRVGALLLITFVLLILVNLLGIANAFLVQPSGDMGLSYYVPATLIFALAVVGQALQSRYLILSYQPPAESKPEPRWKSSGNLTAMASCGNLAVQVPSPGRVSERRSDVASVRDDSPSVRDEEPRSASPQMETDAEKRDREDGSGSSPRRNPSFLTRGGPLSAKSMKALNSGFTAAQFNLFDDEPQAKGAAAAAPAGCELAETVMAAAPAGSVDATLYAEKV